MWSGREEASRYGERLQGLQGRQDAAVSQLQAETGQLGTLEAHADRLEALRTVCHPWCRSRFEICSLFFVQYLFKS